jgi:acetolactate synthase I/II/III large subunit
VSALATRLAAALAAAGCDTVFGLPGGGPNLDVIGAAEAADMRFVLAHGETAATIMAGAYGLLTGQPAPVVVTRGPGAASAANGVAQATLDRAPVVVITDTVPADQAHRVAHQRLDQRALMVPLAKCSATVSDQTSEAELAGLIGAAVRWPYGAVHLDYDASASVARHRSSPPSTGRGPDAGATARARELLERSRRPVVIAGVEAAALYPSLTSDLERFGCPVLTTYQAIGAIPTEHDLWAGLFTNGMLERPLLEAADLIVTIGLDLVEPIPAPWTLPAPVLRLSSVPQTDAYVAADADLVGDLPALVRDLPDGRFEWADSAGRAEREAARARVRQQGSGALGPVELVDAMLDVTPPTVTVTVDAGAHFLAVMPLWPVRRRFGLLISNGLATMGYALPAAIGAALARPGEPVLALTGDGGLGMVLAELETVSRLGLPITTVVFDDAGLSLIGIKQGAAQGGPEAVRYDPVDFAQIARAVGMRSATVRSAADIAATLGAPWDGARLIDARIDPAPYRGLLAVARG